MIKSAGRPSKYTLELVEANLILIGGWARMGFEKLPDDLGSRN